ncbi:polysaccharide biosynthesis protein [Bacillus haynesii]|uniref:polysaccharide biosynthesis protein n=1 Tax=Bacillus haynesii TaxID=1925021 RepID=UPI001593082F|nr:polysaccharide biosynthesis protein [Bacillus haynesii]NVB33647.1 polysaccharide biosynthesis protein [Bacillus licheniformis]MCY7781179.1 polysaccharide biosynthesis protein [Bacillus haynesii]MCY7816021.1 polysaccharide biosynthesis protein [Bacillus haynesii]MCY8222966.1 polysaccharide biosynthesis protein [Bacillus haynesii]MCY8241966.1 polysaccharide biosynthesis protein [Bacillus haynesii]
MNRFVKGIVLLSLAAFFAECLEFVINMILARELGEHGMGLYMSVLPSIFLVVVIASLELPVSISKFIAESSPKLHESMLKHALRMTAVCTVFSTAAAVIILPFIPVFDSYHPLIRGLVIGMIPTVAFTSIARGYFMGVQQMGKIATANALKKIFQLLGLFLFFQWYSFELDTSLLISLFVLVASEVVVFVYLFSQFVLVRRAAQKGQQIHLRRNDVLKRLLTVSIPTTGLRVFHAVTNAVEPFLVKGTLLAAGVSRTSAIDQFGMLSGVAMTIGFFPAFIAHSLMVVMIPSISESYAYGQYERVIKRIKQAIFITLFYGIPSVMVMYHFAEPLTHLFFDSAKASFYLKMLWPYFLFHFFAMPFQACLIGMGLAKDAFYHNVWASVLSFLMMYVLGSMQTLQMTGIILAMNTGMILLTALHYVTICKELGVTLFLTNKSRSPRIESR